MAESSAESSPSWQPQFRDRVLLCLQQILDRYGDNLAVNPERQPTISQLKTLRHKVHSSILQVAVFGFVSRGKSALLNALLEEPILPIGALNGVTQWPRTVSWKACELEADVPLQVEFIDTPGLGEVAGADRAKMALEIAQNADVLLFIVAGKPNPEECEALKALYPTAKPLLLISNKADLYPGLTPMELWSSLEPQPFHSWLQPTDIVLTAANPAPVKVRNEWPDGRVTEEWEVLPPHIEPLKTKLIAFLQQEGITSVFLNTLQQAELAQKAIAAQVAAQNIEVVHETQSRYNTIKAIGIGVLPFWWLDLPMNLLLDLLLVRSLVNVYELPTTRHEVEALWRTIFFSLFGVALGELASGVFLGIGTSMMGESASFSGVLVWAGTGVLQGLIAQSGSQKVGEATRTYLTQGCTWMPLGPSQLQNELQQYFDPSMQLGRRLQATPPRSNTPDQQHLDPDQKDSAVELELQGASQSE